MDNVRILIVEDEFLISSHIEITLRKLGYDIVDIVESGEEAISASEEKKPDLILMDIMLNGKIDGIEAAHEIYSKLEIPIIFLTAFSDKKLVERAIEKGPFSFIIKPFTDNEIDINIMIALKRHKRNKDRGSESNLHDTNIKSYIENSIDLITIIDRFNFIIYQSPSCKKVLGYSDLLLIGRNFYDFVHPDDKENLTNQLNVSIENYGSIKLKYRFRHENGEWCDIESKCKAIKDHDNNVSVIMLNSSEVT